MVVETIKSDVLIIGGGIAGSFAAVKAKEAGIENVTLVTKGNFGTDGASTFGAGIYYCIRPEDDRDLIFRRQAMGYEGIGFYSGAAGLYDEDWLTVAVDEGYERFVEMDKWGVKVRKNPDGSYKVVPESRGKEPMYMLPGPDTMAALAQKVRNSGVRVLCNTLITDLLTEGGLQGNRVIGAVGFDSLTAEFRVFQAKAVVLATGGSGFKSRWSGHRSVAGEGAAAAYRAGAVMTGWESGNLIVTGTDYDVMGQNPLVGLGARWVNAKGERFMLEYDPACEDKAPTNRLSESCALEIRGGNGPIYLDLSHITEENMEHYRFMYPLTCKMLERVGVIEGNRALKKVEVEPVFVGAFNSTGGGVKVNTRCESSVAGLYACGDAMQNRLHIPIAIVGATVSGARAGTYAAQYAKENSLGNINKEQVERLRAFGRAPMDRKDGIEPDHVIVGVLEAILPYGVSIIGRGDRIEKAIKKVERIRDEEVPQLYASDPHYLKQANEARSLCTISEMFLRSRLMRTESRETCLREDYPYIDNENWLKWTCLKEENNKMKMWTEDLPIDKYKLKPERKKILHPRFEVARRRGIQWG